MRADEFKRRNRARGVLLGLAAGDRIGGPVRMALRVAESLAERERFDPEDILARYLDWWNGGAFDTGPTSASVLRYVAAGIPAGEAGRRVHAETGGLTAGCNPAHRSAALAVSRVVADDELAEAAKAEACLTHRHPLAGDVAAAVVCLCRALIEGRAWRDALAVASEGRLPETRDALAVSPRSRLSAVGYAPAALEAAAWFVGDSANLPEALERSIGFAGSGNYCPVLVGSIGGARWGEEEIGRDWIHHGPALMTRLQRAADRLAR